MLRDSIRLSSTDLSAAVRDFFLVLGLGSDVRTFCRGVMRRSEGWWTLVKW